MMVELYLHSSLCLHVVSICEIIIGRGKDKVLVELATMAVIPDRMTPQLKPDINVVRFSTPIVIHRSLCLKLNR
jgi:hypothetical protein